MQHHGMEISTPFDRELRGFPFIFSEKIGGRAVALPPITTQ